MTELKSNAEAPNYNYGEIITPFQKSGQEWDQPIGYWRKKARMWRVMTITFLLVSGFLLLMFILELLAPQHKIYAVSVTKNGFVKGVGVLNNTYVIPEAITKKFVNKYISAMFLQGGTEDLLQKNRQFVLDFSSGAVGQKFKNFIAKETADKMSYPVTIKKVELISPNTFRAQWSQNKVDQTTGKIIGYSNYEGKFVVDFVTPDQAGLIKVNPLGFSVSQATWNKVNESGNGQEK